MAPWSLQLVHFPLLLPTFETNTGFYNFTAAASFQTSTLARVICLYRLHILQSNDSKRGSRRPGIIFLYLLLLLLQFLTVTLWEQWWGGVGMDTISQHHHHQGQDKQMGAWDASLLKPNISKPPHELFLFNSFLLIVFYCSFNVDRPHTSTTTAITKLNTSHHDKSKRYQIVVAAGSQDSGKSRSRRGQDISIKYYIYITVPI